MPLTAKGREILGHLEQEYGEKKGKSVLYAGKNKGTFTGIDSTRRATLDDVMSACDSYDKSHDRT